MGRQELSKETGAGCVGSVLHSFVIVIHLFMVLSVYHAQSETKHHIFKESENNFKNLLMRKVTGEVLALDAERRKGLMPMY